MTNSKEQFNYQGIEKETHLSEYINVLLRRWKLSLLVAIIVFIAFAAYSSTRIPVYEAFATLEIRKNTEGGMLKELGVEPESALTTEIEILRSRSLALQVVKRMNMEWQIASIDKGLEVAIQQFVVTGNYPGLQLVLTTPAQFRVTDLTGNVLGTGASGELFIVEGITLLVDILKASPGMTLTLERQAVDPLINGIIGSLRVVEMGKGSNILRVSSQQNDPNRARDIVNILTESYRFQNTEGKAEQAGKTVDFINQQLHSLNTVLDRSEQALQEYKLQTGLITLGSEGSGLVDKLVELEQRKAEAGLKRQRIEYAISALKKSMKNGTTFTPPTVEGVPQIAEAATQLAELEARKKSLLIDFTPAHPAVVEIQSQLTRVQDAMLSTYRSVRQALVLEERDIGKTIKGYDEQLEDVPAAELELAKRTRVHTVNAELYTFLLQKQQESRIAQASTISNAEIIDPAVTPKRPISPNHKRNLMTGLFMGLMLGIGLAFLLDYMDQTLKTTEDIQEKLGLPVFGIIPRIPFADEDARLPRKRLVTTLEPKAPVVESFRALRTNLNYITAKEKHKIILVTSSLPSEGKSTVTGNLAVVLAQTGANILLLGCDLRRPSLYEMFQQKNEPGLVNLLMQKDQGALRKIDRPRLDFMPAGSIPPNPAEILESGRMRKFLLQARERYDYVVIDAPPVLPVTDTQILAPLVDINLVVVEPCRVPEKAAKQMVESLKSVDAKIAGVILNDKSGRGFKYYGSYNYYGNKYYRGYYGEEHDEVDGPFVAVVKKMWGKLNS